jgi:predicted MFS family arabinose efflux permease
MLGLLGIAMSDMASGWLMTSLDADPRAVSWVQVATNLPMFLLTLPAGALADMFDLRRFLITVESAVVTITLGFAIMVSLGAASPFGLLTITFALSAAWAAAAPAWLAILPLLIPKRDLDSATAINSAGYNVSRAIGPAIGGIAIAAMGVAAPFWIFGAINVATVIVLLLWRSPRRSGARLPSEPLGSALRVGFHHAANNRHLVWTLGRAVAFFPAVSAYWALLPLLAREQMSGGPESFGVLLSAIGAGAIVGAFVLNWLKGRLGPDRLVDWGALATAAILALLGAARDPLVGAVLCVAAGAAWILVLATLYVSAQVALPDWVRGRGLAIFLTAIFGSMTFGGAIWGQVAQTFGLPIAFLSSAACLLLAIPATRRWKLQTGANADLAPCGHWRPPNTGRAVEDFEGPILVVTEYQIEAVNRALLLRELDEMKHERKRDGAYAWGVFADPADGSLLWETFLIESWLEFRLFCGRVSNDDRLVEDRIRGLLVRPPTMRIMIAPK